MLRTARIVLMVLVATFVVAAPTALAQAPVTDQYVTDDGAPVDDEGGGAPAEDVEVVPGDAGGSAPVEVSTPSRTVDSGTLPFTGAQISLIALIGLALLALGAVGLAASRRRASTTAS